MGIPLAIMELGLGQKFQRGDVSVFRNINPRLAGIGIVSVVACYTIALYYIVIIGWGVCYFISSLRSPLPWASTEVNPNFPANCAKVDWKIMESETGLDYTACNLPPWKDVRQHDLNACAVTLELTDWRSSDDDGDDTDTENEPPNCPTAA